MSDDFIRSSCIIYTNKSYNEPMTSCTRNFVLAYTYKRANDNSLAIPCTTDFHAPAYMNNIINTNFLNCIKLYNIKNTFLFYVVINRQKYVSIFILLYKIYFYVQKIMRYINNTHSHEYRWIEVVFFLQTFE